MNEHVLQAAFYSYFFHLSKLENKRNEIEEEKNIKHTHAIIKGRNRK